MLDKLSIPDVLGHVIVKYRMNRGITAEMLAAHLGKSVRHVSNIENGHSKPGYTALVDIIRFLGIPADEVFYPEKEDGDFKRQQLHNAIDLCSEERIETLTAFWKALPPE